MAHYGCNDLLTILSSIYSAFFAVKNRQKNLPWLTPSDKIPFIFEVLNKGKNKFDSLVHEMYFMRALKPHFNVQSDSIRAKGLP